ncbi:ribosomal protein L14E/L6E/L27E [Clostridium algifaecis]|uniref:Ribosomal protein L14E/L6E/L27E n=1 Tax=Clostridium algifaecis TaxID=1472040 RepID=A0ABS4KUG3_9CLOT|nr:KOW domain-containing RNA-binding protein [Clostridium algifaecis]MBP2033101.1 ribosomal protein L14E/L6E/L27E [Clostridium algifaecis]
MTLNSCIGIVVSSKVGRDAGKIFIITGILDDNHVYISDGKRRPLEKPKKKRLKHLFFTSCVAENIRDLLNTGSIVTNSMIMSFLQSYDKNKEV